MVRIRNFGGPLVWLLRKNASGFTTRVAYLITAQMRDKKIKKYISEFCNSEVVPDFKFLMIETVNRCNGKCSFCPANIRDEKREYAQMPMDIIEKVLDELSEINWNGTILPFINNEPFIDNRIFEVLKKIRSKCPQCRVHIITNGSLLNKHKMDDLKGLVDILTINDYSEKYELSDNIQMIYDYVVCNKEFDDIDITIARRYTKEVLSTRAGNAPNKPKKKMKMNYPCIYPFTDLAVFPNGNVGVCCNDCYEKTMLGNVQRNTLREIWRGEGFDYLRQCMIKGREAYSFCRECDVIDAGSREKAIESNKGKLKI